MARHTQDTYQTAAWYIRAADRLASDPTLAQYMSALLGSDAGQYQVDHYQWLVTASKADVANYAKHLA